MGNETQEERSSDCPIKINLDPAKKVIEDLRVKILSSNLKRLDQDEWIEGRNKKQNEPER